MPEPESSSSLPREPGNAPASSSSAAPLEGEVHEQPAAPARDDASPRFTVDVFGKSAAETFTRLKTDVAYWAARGRYQKVRIKRAGKPVLPDIPIGALVAVEAATFFWTGMLRAALVNVVGRALFEVELINEAEEHYRKGLSYLLAGDLPDAELLFARALSVDERHARTHLQLGVLRKMQGRKDDARTHFERCIAVDAGSLAAREADVHLKKLAV